MKVMVAEKAHQHEVCEKRTRVPRHGRPRRELRATLVRR